MATLVLNVGYNGHAYRGWQRQLKPNLPTVQAHLEQALSSIANHPLSVFCAGRTDARVHACAQVVHCTPQVERPLKAWVQGVNTQLPSDVRVNWAQYLPLDSDFHARFSATARHYRYIIFNAKVVPAQLIAQVTQVKMPLDVVAMQQAAQYLVGEHDFSSFRGSGCQSNSAYRNVHFIRVTRSADLVFIDIKANAFLLHMVRNITGMLIAIGQAKYAVDDMQQVLLARDRCAADVTAAPYGLYLVGVDYPQHYNLQATYSLPFIAVPEKV